MSRIPLAMAAALLSVTASPVFAKGCLKGAAVGAVAGHYVGKGHAVLGAAAGCWYGHHLAAKAARNAKAQPRPHAG